jgi:hypothetical protein
MRNPCMLCSLLLAFTMCIMTVTMWIMMFAERFGWLGL